MTHTPPPPARKLSRTGLYVPFILAGILAILWSLGWFWLKGEAERRIDRMATGFAAHGGRLVWSARRVHGYPFRLDVDFTNPVIADASGWSFSAPALETESFVFDPGHWMFVVPKGASFSWPGGGPATVEDVALRASIDGLDQHPPRFSLEGEGLSFTTAPGAKPFFVTSARAFQVYTRPGPNDQGAIFINLNNAAARPDNLFGRIADGGPVNLSANLIFPHASQLAGDWAPAVRRWSKAGGRLAVRQVTVQLGDTVFDARSGSLGIGDDGRLDGDLAGELRGAARSASPATPKSLLTVRDGHMSLAGVDLGTVPAAF